MCSPMSDVGGSLHGALSWGVLENRGRKKQGHTQPGSSCSEAWVVIWELAEFKAIGSGGGVGVC